MSEPLYRKVELEEDTLVQYLAVYVTKWRPEWGEPSCGFVDAELPPVSDDEEPA